MGHTHSWSTALFSAPSTAPAPRTWRPICCVLLNFRGLKSNKSVPGQLLGLSFFSSITAIKSSAPTLTQTTTVSTTKNRTEGHVSLMCFLFSFLNHSKRFKLVSIKWLQCIEFIMLKQGNIFGLLHRRRSKALRQEVGEDSVQQVMGWPWSISWLRQCLEHQNIAHYGKV